MPAELPVVAVTMGDVAGVGPQVVAEAVCRRDVRETCHPVIIGCADVLHRAAGLSATSTGLKIQRLSPLPVDRSALQAHLMAAADSGQVLCLDSGDAQVAAVPPGKVSAVAGHAAFCWLKEAIRLAKEGLVDAIATAPLNKAALHAAGHNFPGHTEILARECGVSSFAMMLHLPESRLAQVRAVITGESCLQESVSGASGISIAHVTLHTSVASVPGLLTTARVQENIELLDSFLRRIDRGRRSIGVCALNPHGGEDGLFGDEESRLIAPAIESCVAGGDVDCSGPFPVDTLIRRAVAGEFDGIVAMYHDQGHIPVKLIGFDDALNITLGLPIIRTSPTHGTAFDKAWKPGEIIRSNGMAEAIRMAARLAARKQTQKL